MKRIFSRFFAVIISVTFIFAVSSCKGKNNADSEQGIYNAESSEFPDSLDIASKIFPVGKNIAVIGLKENNDISDIKLEIFDESGTVKFENTIYSVDNTSENYRTFEFMRCSSDENIISAEIEFTNDGKNLFYIVKYDPESGKNFLKQI